MRLACVRLSLAGLACLAPSLASAAPPPLPEGDVEPSATPGDAASPGPDAAPPPAPDAAAPEDEALPPTADAGAGASADGSLELGGSIEAGAAGATDAETVTGVEKSTTAEGGEDEGEADRPARVRGRHEPMMQMNGGAIGLFYTTLPDTGGKYSFRFRLHTDFFRKDGFIYNADNVRAGQATPGVQRRRGRWASRPFEWGELFFSINSPANRNPAIRTGASGARRRCSPWATSPSGPRAA